MRTVLNVHGPVKIQFKHERFTAPVIHDRKQHEGSTKPRGWGWISAETVCRLVGGPREDERDVIDPGYARCSTADKYVKETAREVALLHMLGVDKRFDLADPRQRRLVLTPEDTGRVLAAYYGRKRGQQPHNKQE